MMGAAQMLSQTEIHALMGAAQMLSKTEAHALMCDSPKPGKLHQPLSGYTHH